jgi:elongation factor 1-alpha
LISISIIGHVDSGKSTLAGRLATVFSDYDARAQEKMAKIAADNKKDSFVLAYFTDKTEQERKRGVTINTTLVEMQTDKFRINFLDCPGHVDYIKNATNGCKQSDLSIVVVPADFQASCSTEGTLGTHLTLAAVLGSKNFIVCINKLDEIAEKNASDVETTFEAASAAVYKLLKKLGVKKELVFFLPVSALKGIGLFKNGEKYPFFKGCIPAVPKPGFEVIYTLEEAIDYQDIPVRPLTLPLRLPISGIAHVPGHGAIFCGRIDYGTMKRGDNVKFLPIGLKSEVKNIQAHKKDIDIAEAGMNIGFNIISKEKLQVDKIKNGFMVGPAEDSAFASYPFYVASCFSLKPKGKSGSEERGIRAGYTPVISCGTANVACKFVKILSSYTKDNVKIENPEFVTKDARFTALLYPTKQVLFENFKDFPALGKFVCRDSGILVAAGQIVECLTEEQAVAKYSLNMTDILGQKPAASEAKKKSK